MGMTVVNVGIVRMSMPQPPMPVQVGALDKMHVKPPAGA
jgi:hypothetical protein